MSQGKTEQNTANVEAKTNKNKTANTVVQKPSEPNTANVESLVSTVELMQQQMAKLAADNQLLLKVADRHRLQRQRDAEGKRGPDELGVRFYEEYDTDTAQLLPAKVVTGWGPMLRNYVTEKNMDDHNAQQVQVFFHDGTNKILTYYDFAVVNTKLHIFEAKRKEYKTGHDHQEHLFYVIEYNGQEISIEDTFID